MLTGIGITAGYQAPVVTDVSLTVHPGQTVGLAGPSGSGKSTVARVLALLHKPFAGTVEIDGETVTGFRFKARQRTRIGVLFQQPRLSVDPRFTLRQAIAEPGGDRVDELADLVMLTDDLLGRRPHEVSDGQLQRACLARALALKPRYLICDEMTTMLDASTTAALVGVIRAYQRESGAGVLAISHDTTLLTRWADETVRLSAPLPR
ncbi:ABC transporter ATP-binding protein [Lentzea flaviverrucosa]|uniref:ABC-type dipeptide/oligopeptide/nickel transport system, ATPase component n=1 Tax=Lentzea flaviverrucosa TaxID=200379 RepID=A0A1H9FJR1_9PSEU|nr:ATP-binding cassette domain-containing protein [Lentzea flaviverrucosa]RDI35175.1 ABC-type dipeptide/oligopeptide/nickel transport system ATPase subunit [Lentzea flaviverrucosa]SEQ38181.1 ABC-type dipeptide/oligopeptide/nickel transport system, ATPase component [Lentzea flaviverrucosa]